MRFQKTNYPKDLQSSLDPSRRAKTAFDDGVNGLTWLLIRLILMMAVLVFFINWLAREGWGDAMLFSAAVAVGLTPEMLSVIVTATVARGARELLVCKGTVEELRVIGVAIREVAGGPDRQYGLADKQGLPWLASSPSSTHPRRRCRSGRPRRPRGHDQDA